MSANSKDYPGVATERPYPATIEEFVTLVSVAAHALDIRDWADNDSSSDGDAKNGSPRASPLHRSTPLLVRLPSCRACSPLTGSM